MDRIEKKTFFHLFAHADKLQAARTWFDATTARPSVFHLAPSGPRASDLAAGWFIRIGYSFKTFNYIVLIPIYFRQLRKRVTLYTTAPYLFELGQQLDPLQRLGCLCDFSVDSFRCHLNVFKPGRLPGNVWLDWNRRWTWSVSVTTKTRLGLRKFNGDHISNKAQSIQLAWVWRPAVLDLHSCGE